MPSLMDSILSPGVLSPQNMPMLPGAAPMSSPSQAPAAMPGYAAPVAGGPPIPDGQDPSVPHGILGKLKDVAGRIGTGFTQETSGTSGHKALRAFGAAMLGAPNFWQGLSQGTQAFDATRDAEDEKNKPKNQLVADGAFLASTDRDGNTTFTPNKDIQTYQQGLAQDKFDNQRALLHDKQGGQMDIAKLHEDNRHDLAVMAEQGRQARNDANNQFRMLLASMTQAGKTANGGMAKPMPAGVSKGVDDHIGNVQSYENVRQDLEPVLTAVSSGKLKLDALHRAAYEAQLKLGVGVSDEARMYGQLVTARQELTAADLRKNRGVQTEGDASRSLEAMFAGTGDDKYLTDRITTLRSRLARSAQQETWSANRILKQYGQEPVDIYVGSAAPAATTTTSKVPSATATPPGVRRVANDKDYAALPKGTRYLAPDGKMRVKQ